ncbi:MAG: phosphate ABC transporter substrate-binding protein PstS family protein [Chloroflexi bacterium]|nr:phosphate ABC transporter substrate-binding protein PstS family protein [Chloroflexota bacterium]
MIQSINRRLWALLIAAVLTLTACASTPGASATAGSSPSVNISGSSTVQPISEAVAERFNEDNPGTAITVDGPGTGDGFELFCAGETDISDASRAIKEEETAACQEAGIEYVELKVAIDGLSVLTSTENTGVECLTFADLYALIGPESTGLNNWNDAEALAQELGSTTDLPDAELSITGPGEESGTYDSFVELVFGDIAEERGQEEATRPDYTSSANDNAIIEGISGSPTSLGWVGFAFAEENAEVVREIAVDGGEGCVEPTPETISSGEYPIARDLYIYVNKAKMAENDALVAYVDYYLAEGVIDSVLEEVPYVPLADETLEESRSTWEGAKAGE